MQKSPRRRPSRAASLALTLLLGLGLLGIQPLVASSVAQAAGFSKPTGLVAVKVSGNAVALTWKAAKNAPAYRVSFSTKSNMSGSRTMDVVGNYLEWNRLNPDAVTASPRLNPNTNYYFRVKVISLAKATLSSYSKTVKVKTASATSFPELAPVALKATPRSDRSMYISWSSRGPGIRYRIAYGTQARLPAATSRFISSSYSEAALYGLTSGVKYYYKVKVLSSDGRELSPYSATKTLRPPTSPLSPPLTVATYNVCSNAGSCASTWQSQPPAATDRLPAVANNLATQNPDIAAIEEILPGSPLVDLLSSWNTAAAASGLSRNYQTTDSPTRRGVGTARLVYDANRFSLGDHGVQALTSLPDDNKYAVWAVLTDSQSGKSLFAVATHLTVGTENYTVRQTQAQQIVDLIAARNAANLPVVIAGDFNSGKAYQPSNTIYDVLSAAGYRDPLGNTNNSWAVDPSATAEHRVDLEYNTYNGFATHARVAKYANGYDIDYIWHNAGVRVAVSRVAVDLDTAGNFIGVIPSDHNMLLATIHLK